VPKTKRKREKVREEEKLLALLTISVSSFIDTLNPQSGHSEGTLSALICC